MERKIYNNRIGEVYTNNQGLKMTIIECFGTYNNTVRFEDGSIRKKIEFYKIKTGRVKRHVNHTGEKYVSNEGYEMTIIEDLGWDKCKVKFNNNYVTISTYSCIKKGNISNPYHPSVYGKGYTGEGVYDTKGANSLCYKKWNGMLERAYSKDYHIKKPTYIGCTVDERWHNFQVFAEWFHKTWKYFMDNTWQLDKDIVKKGNKTYSPETCEIIPRTVNSLLVKNDARRGNLPIGVTLKHKKFFAQINKNGKVLPLGYFNTPEEAFSAYKEAKEEWIKEVANKWRSKITERCYWALINYQVEITD